MGITYETDMHKNKRTNKTKDMLINMMHKIYGSDSNIRERKIFQK